MGMSRTLPAFQLVVLPSFHLPSPLLCTKEGRCSCAATAATQEDGGLPNVGPHATGRHRMPQEFRTVTAEAGDSRIFGSCSKLSEM